MERTPLLPLPEGMLIDEIQITENGLGIAVVATHPTSCCPLCSDLSSSIQSHYRRVLRDVPCAGRRVQLFLTVRKFSCRNPLCQQKIFTERLPAFVEPWARMTIRHCQHPDLMAISRDRGGEYASAAAAGAPQAIQCADRFHLLKNLREALEGLLARHLATRVANVRYKLSLMSNHQRGNPNERSDLLQSWRAFNTTDARSV
jgi:transposase